MMRLFTFFLFLFAISRLSIAQDATLNIGPAKVPIRILERVMSLRTVTDSIVRDKKHRADNCSLGTYSSHIEISPKDVVHFRREIFNDSNFVWTRMTNDEIWGTSHYVITFMADSLFYYDCTMRIVDEAMRLDPVTLVEETTVRSSDGPIYAKYYLGDISRRDLITSILNSFDLPRQIHLKLSYVEMLYIPDSSHYTEVYVDLIDKNSINTFTKTIAELPAGATLFIHRFYVYPNDGETYYQQNYPDAILHLKD